MKQYTHAWLASMAMKRLNKVTVPADSDNSRKLLVEWFLNHRDFVLQGAWYPDAIIKDMSTGHVLKFKPDVSSAEDTFKKLPDEYYLKKIGEKSPFFKKPYKIVGGNLPDRCEAISHTIVDHLKMQYSEKKGSPISPTNNQIATLFFMLSHYIADAHMPLHCDARAFSSMDNIHGKIEAEWDDIIQKCYGIDKDNKRFIYDTEGYPNKIGNHDLVDWLETEILTRKFELNYGPGNDNTWDFMKAITQYSYLTAFQMIPQEYDENNLDWKIFKTLNTEAGFDDYSKCILSDAIDSVAKIWLRIWNRYQLWIKDRDDNIGN
jgi:hypothetical protein